MKMNKEKISELFEDHVSTTRIYNEYKVEVTEQIIDFIYDIIIPKLVINILPEYEIPKLGSENQSEYIAYSNGFNDAIDKIKFNLLNR